MEEVTSGTSTWRPYNQQELHEMMLEYLLEYVQTPWWRKRKPLLKNAINCAGQYDLINKAIKE